MIGSTVLTLALFAQEPIPQAPVLQTPIPQAPVRPLPGMDWGWHLIDQGGVIYPVWGYHVDWRTIRYNPSLPANQRIYETYHLTVTKP